MDIYFLQFIGSPQHGWIDISSKKMSRFDFLYRLTTAKAALFSIKLIPGETTYIFLHQLSNQYGFSEKKLHKAYTKLAPYREGVLVPQTYFLPKGIDEKGLMRYLVTFSLRFHKKVALTYLGKFDLKNWFKKYIVIASIIQKEAANKKEMPLISAVIYNRLKKGIPLQMDGTLNYGRYSHIKVTAKRIRTDKSIYNTYIHKGLPPYPVCVVSLEAIKAAIRPAKVDYLYFVKGKNGRHIFSKSYKNHLKNVKKCK